MLGSHPESVIVYPTICANWQGVGDLVVRFICGVLLVVCGLVVMIVVIEVIWGVGNFLDVSC